MKSILLVEDNVEVQNLVKISLGKDYKLFLADGLEQGKKILKDMRPDLVLLDISLSDGDGFKFCTHIKGDQALNNIPILFLTAHGNLENKLLAFKIGADDYIIKPFNPKELLARVEAVLRRSIKQVEGDTHIKLGGLDLDSLSFRAKYNGTNLDLPPLEFKVLFYLCKNIDQPLTRENIIKVSWSSDISVTDRVVDVCMSNLRKKLRDTEFKIESVYGVGYRFKHNKTKSLE